MVADGERPAAAARGGRHRTRGTGQPTDPRAGKGVATTRGAFRPHGGTSGHHPHHPSVCAAAWAQPERVRDGRTLSDDGARRRRC